MSSDPVLGPYSGTMIGALGEKLRARVTAGLERARPVRERLRRRRLRRGSGDSSGELPSSTASTPRRVRLEATPEPPGGDSRRGSTAGDMTSEVRWLEGVFRGQLG